MKKDQKKQPAPHSLLWSLTLLTVGSLVYVLGYNGIAASQRFVPGGLYGLAALVHDAGGGLSTAVWYVLFNAPVFLLALRAVGKRFFLLNLYCMGLIAVLTALLHPDFGIQDRLHAAIASGAVMGAGCGIILRSSGAGGGLDVLAFMLNRRFGLRYGVFYFLVNGLIMLGTAARMEPDLVVASIVLQFLCSVVTEYVLSVFNQRKAVWIISSRTREISQRLASETSLGGTIMQGRGGYSGGEVEILFSITHNMQVKVLEDMVFEIDPQALFVVENTFNVIGGGFGRPDGITPAGRTRRAKPAGSGRNRGQ
ncbi:putative membrane protein [Desulfovibrio sp. DV]|uniref:YitT family protein n=1 Tax=Desulfovibrio sp. DV TaxID=1844708 RepID=UPI00094BC54E|nr:YitT family protein [Desulfovibrio sp. DV]OLN28286.1 putative membrane protein [Desulfovibrio sp. DV]